MHQHTQSPAVSSTGKHSTLRRRAENLAAVLIWAAMSAMSAVYPAAVIYWAGRAA
ncbi:hypothetical protein NicSoilB8_13940 [Arthrobacter sp. NicSoilB8]|nr:hypothetical protein NicSoilB8_13940 [Arthrobacter sp. NicSoilB8]